MENSESNSEESNPSLEKQKPLGTIRVYRRFYNPSNSLYIALRYVKNHKASLGSVPHAALEVFGHFYAPLGMHELGGYSDEIVQATGRSISFIEGQLRYLKDLYESVKTTQSVSPNYHQPESENIPNHSNEHSNGHSSNSSPDLDFL